MLLFLLYVFVSSSLATTKDNICCLYAKGSCYTACNQLKTREGLADWRVKDKRLKTLASACPRSMSDFWNCMDAVITGASWNGRKCCETAQSMACRLSCASATATNQTQLLSSCRHSDEITLFTCIQRQKRVSDCCGQAKSPACHHSCISAHSQNIPPATQAQRNITRNCRKLSPKVVECANNLTNDVKATDTLKYMDCCSKSKNVECQNACYKLTGSHTPLQDILDQLSNSGCGLFMPHDELWQCFLRSERSPPSTTAAMIEQVGMDSVKLWCCSRAVGPNCRQLCLQTFSDQWLRVWSQFSSQCLFSSEEHLLRDCLEEVEEPCRQGCSGLEFCSNFNDRPDESFRSCSKEADLAAKNDVMAWWEQGVVKFESGLNFPLTNSSTCDVSTIGDVIIALACALQIKPCSPGGTKHVCKKDCDSLAKHCVEARICEHLAIASETQDCVPIEKYLQPAQSKVSAEKQIATHVCQNSNCDDDEVCIVNRNCQDTEDDCAPYHCMPGCRLGEASWYVVPIGTHAVIPTGFEGCVKLCECTQARTIQNCRPVPCSQVQDCWIANQRIEHGTKFVSDCNVCSCISGELTCSKKQCTSPSTNDVDITSPCGCPQHNVPVCAYNGQTFTNPCLARCVGLSEVDYAFGPCSSQNPCEGNPCEDEMKCYPAPKLCLSLLEKPCRQYSCHHSSLDCSDQEIRPICDSKNQQHNNTCFLEEAGQKFSYGGNCVPHCSAQGTVCGADGNAYLSECQALALKVLPDYEGTCGSTFNCRPLPPEGCLGFHPPGASCPVCGGGLRLHLSKKRIDRARLALKHSANTDILSVHSVLKSLERQVRGSHTRELLQRSPTGFQVDFPFQQWRPVFSSAVEPKQDPELKWSFLLQVDLKECLVVGYLLAEQDLIVAIIPISNPTTSISEMSRKCSKQAEILANGIHESNPRFLSELDLNVLIAAQTLHTFVQSTASIMSSVLPLLLFLVGILSTLAN